LGIGVVGMGWMGDVHSRAYRQLTDRYAELEVQPELVICADAVVTRAHEAQRRHGFGQTSQHWQDVTSHQAVDVVHVTTPNSQHKEILLAALKAGKHVFCEKPVGCSTTETAEIAAAAQQANVTSGVGYNYRWAPVVQYARQLIRDGKLGDITHYRGRFLVDYASNPDSVLSWRFQREHAGTGTLGDLMSHCVDLAHMLAGSISQVVSNHHTFISERPQATPGEGTHFSVDSGGPKGPVTNEDYVSALARFSNGAQGSFEVCRAAFGHFCENVIEVNGTKGRLLWNYERMNELHLHLADGGPENNGPTRLQAGPEHPSFSTFYPGAGNCMGYEDLKVIETANFVKAILKQESCEPGLNEAWEVAKVQAAMERSWKSEKWEDVEDVS